MSYLLTLAVKSIFTCTSRRKATASAEKMRLFYMHLAQGVDEAVGRRIVEVPSMPGVDEDMRNWSFYMILEHNTIVNQSITASMRQLARGESLHDEARIDLKHDVLPSLNPGPEQVALFDQSIKDHLTTVKTLPTLRGTSTSPHPLFGEFDAHFWHCLFAFHLKLHLHQTKMVLQKK